MGVDHHSIRNWISIYQYDGPTGLRNQPKNKSYSKDLKISAINAVSYTHLWISQHIYHILARLLIRGLLFAVWNTAHQMRVAIPVSYTHLDVYKRQDNRDTHRIKGNL